MAKELERVRKTQEKFAKMPFRCDHCGNGMDPEVCEANGCGKPATVFSYYEYPYEDYDGYFDPDYMPGPPSGGVMPDPSKCNRHWFIRCADHCLKNDHRTPNLVDSTKEECLVYLAMHQ